MPGCPIHEQLAAGLRVYLAPTKGSAFPGSHRETRQAPSLQAEDELMTGTNRTVLITGSAQRIGRALALDFASRGWHVGLHYNASPSQAAKLVGDIEALGVNAAILRADLTDAHATERLLEACSSVLGAASCLINNAATFRKDELASLDPATWDIQLAVNLKAPVFLAKHFARHLPAGMQGNIINIIDQRVWRPTPQFFSYAVSKAALWSATRMLAQALAPRRSVRSNAPP